MSALELALVEVSGAVVFTVAAIALCVGPQIWRDNETFWDRPIVSLGSTWTFCLISAYAYIAYVHF